MIDRKLLEILACPVCKGEVKEKEGKICCPGCGRKYPIRSYFVGSFLSKTKNYGSTLVI